MSVTRRLEPVHKDQENGFRNVAERFNTHDHAQTPYTLTADGGARPGVTQVDASGGVVTVDLPKASAFTGRVLSVIKVDATGNAVTLDGYGSETINGATTHALAAQWDSATVYSDGSNWVVL